MSTSRFRIKVSAHLAAKHGDDREIGAEFGLVVVLFAHVFSREFNGVRRVFFGLDPRAEVRAEQVTTTRDGIRFELCLGEKRYPVRMEVAGRHNVQNALAAAAAANALEVAGETIARGWEEFRPSPGVWRSFGLRRGGWNWWRSRTTS